MELASEKSEGNSNTDAPQPIQLFVEFVADRSDQPGLEPELSFADPPAAGLALLKEFQKLDVSGITSERDAVSARFVATLYETVALAPGEMTVPVNVHFKLTEKADGDKKPADTLAVVLRTTLKTAVHSDSDATGVFLIGGTLDLRLGHLCDQQGCVHHFHQSLSSIRGLGAVNPQPSLKDPRATAYLRAGQPIDVWSLREDLRDQSVEVTGIVPRGLSDYRLRIEFHRWNVDEGIQQCVSCRERVASVLENLDWATDITVAGGGINFRSETPDLDLVTLLDAITDSGAAPSAVWLVPSGVPMPKAAKALDIHVHAHPKAGGRGSQAHPIIEFDLAHTCDVGSSVGSLLHQQKWASESHVNAGDITFARALIADRKYAGLTPILSGLRSAGHTPREIRLREFGDIRIQLEFARICGDVVFSKPPKPKKKKKDDGKDDGEVEKKVEKPKKPFVPQPLSMATSSNGRNAIKAAIESVEWVRDGLFYDYHTKFKFRGGPRKITFALQASGDDIVRLDELIDALRDAGFPPKSVVVSRRFSGIPFGKPLPADLELTDRDGKKLTLGSFRKPERPLVVAFVCLKTKSRKYGKYEADPMLFERLGRTIESYNDRVDVVALSANEHDEFPDVAEFWDRTGLTVPLLHDPNGTARAVFNMQITPPPHMFVFDADGLLRYGGDAHSHWEKPDEKHEDYLAQALDLVIAKKFLKNGAVFYKSSLCNCSHPKCKCPKCGCGSTCRCGIKHCGVGF
jgi:peroxiredoxin